VLNFRYNKMLIISSLIASLFVDSGARRGFCRSRARRKCPQFCDLGRPGIRAPCETAVRGVRGGANLLRCGARMPSFGASVLSSACLTAFWVFAGDLGLGVEVDTLPPNGDAPRIFFCLFHSVGISTKALMSMLSAHAIDIRSLR
jgi:hypothetical protein